jgi:hypothetical protein
MAAVYDGAATSIYGNGVLGETRALVLNTLTNGNFLVGARTWSPSEYWTGQIAEVILFAYALNDTERMAIETYLATKWGL